MKLVLTRNIFTERSTIGSLTVNGVLQCYTIEDTDRRLELGGIKIPKQTAIPRGTYKVILSYSPRFKKYLPLLLNVPCFKGIRIHPGNTSDDTEGCLLPVSTLTKEGGLYSKIAFDDLLRKIKAVEKTEDITITIR